MSRQTIRKSGTERRKEIALAALEIIGREGLTALTTAAVAEKIGLSSGALFRHFDTREDILDEAVRQAELQIEATVPDDALPPLERLRALALARIKLLSKKPGLAWLLRSRQALLILPPAAVRNLQGLARRSRTYIQTALDEAMQEGQVRNDIALDVLLLIFTATVHALIGQPGIQGRGARSTQTAKAVEGLLATLAPAASQKRKR